MVKVKDIIRTLLMDGNNVLPNMRESYAGKIVYSEGEPYYTCEGFTKRDGAVYHLESQYGDYVLFALMNGSFVVLKFGAYEEHGNYAVFRYGTGRVVFEKTTMYEEANVAQLALRNTLREKGIERLCEIITSMPRETVRLSKTVQGGNRK